MEEIGTPAAIPWYQSRIIRRLALSIVMQIIAVTHLSARFAGANLGLLVDDLLELAGIAYAAWAAHSRLTNKALPDLTTTQAKADIKNQPTKE
jgi:hypothetical protein